MKPEYYRSKIRSPLYNFKLAKLLKNAFGQISRRPTHESDWMHLIQFNENLECQRFTSKQTDSANTGTWPGNVHKLRNGFSFIYFDTNEHSEVFIYEDDLALSEVPFQDGRLKKMRPAIRLFDQKQWALVTNKQLDRKETSSDTIAEMIFDAQTAQDLRHEQHLPDGRTLKPFCVHYSEDRHRQKAPSNRPYSEPNYFVGILTPLAKTDLFDFIDPQIIRDDLWLLRQLHIMYRLALDLAHLHANGVVHLDLKPANILLYEHPNQARNRASSPIPVIIDFDASVIFKPSAAENGPPRSRTFSRGTCAYMEPYGGPRQKRMSSWQDATKLDIYSLACVFNEMLLTARPRMIEYDDIFGNENLPDHVLKNLAKRAGRLREGRARLRPNGIWLGRQQPVSSSPLRSLLLRMSSPNLTLRPTALEVADLLADMLRSRGSALRRAWFWPETMLWP